MSDETFIAGGTKYECPKCGMLGLISRNILKSSLPVVLKCGEQACGYRVLFEAESREDKPIFPKVDPMRMVPMTWVIEMQEGSTKDYWKTPELGQQSFRKRAENIATHLAGGLQAIQSLQQDLDTLAAKMTTDFQAEWERMSAFQRLWNPGRMRSFITQPWIALPLPTEDTLVQPRCRLVVHPNFFVPELGIPLRGFGGFQAQVITPYTQFHFPVESWIASLMGMPPSVDLYVSGNKILGTALFHCWRDIPGTIIDHDHHDDAPSICIETSMSRAWLAKLGVRPWAPQVLNSKWAYEALWTFMQGAGVSELQKEIFAAYEKQGRIALFIQDELEAWRFALTMIVYSYGHKLVLVTNLQDRERYMSVLKEERDLIATKTLHWKEVKDLRDFGAVSSWNDQYKLLIVHYTADMPPEWLFVLHEWKGRLIIIADDPLMDTAQSNYEASEFYSLVNETIIHPTNPGLRTVFNYKHAQECLTASLLGMWFDQRQQLKAD